ncbi:AAA family ATPase [Micromonospora sp. CPCC 206060]|uniref:HelD family protein n=1 Tax=Micromonospora sp. CPCC 206060 TaxID=3122406 RepID=UPI002FF196E4
MTGPGNSAATESRAQLTVEYAYLSRVRDAQEHLLATVRMRVDTGADIAGDGWTAETLGRLLRGQARELACDPHAPPYFGRLDFDTTPAAGEHRGARYYLGRRHLTDPTGRPLVLDWRAPVSARFYRASAVEPAGVRRRRRFGWRTGRDRAADLTGFEDEELTAGHLTDSPGDLVLAEIERPRIGPMRDIVATIQPEQDRLVRATLGTTICVQGAPGTGKTAVGLHRAAYLLYTHPRQLDRNGLLVLGPNPAFLRYIADVLPALGERDVARSTVDALVARVPVRAADGLPAALVKHDLRMAEVLRRALYARVGAPGCELVVPDGAYRWRVPVETLRRIVDGVRAEGLRYLPARERLRARVVAAVQRQAETREAPGAAWVRRISRSRPVTALVDATWPAVRPEELVAAMLGGPDLLARVADGILTAGEQEVIRWPRARSWRTAPWTAADLVLIDEAAGLLDRPPGFGHIVVDEAQDLSPMQCRVVARRSSHGSLTVLGDLAQGTTPWAAVSWRSQLAHLGQPDAEVLPLTDGFRVPAEVVRLANRLLAALDADVPLTRAVRTGGRVRFRRTDDPVAAAVAAACEALSRPGSLGVIAADRHLAPLAAALTAAGLSPTVDGTAGADDGRITLLTADQAKGLEFDRVVLVEPAAIMATGARGAHRLYVALTRAVSGLEILHAEPLPAGLAPAGTDDGPDAPERG